MDPYEALGVTPATPLPEIEAAYRTLLRRYHPDLHQADGPSAVANAEAMTRRITLAMAHVRADHGRGARPADGERVRHHRPRTRPDHRHAPRPTEDWSSYQRSDPLAGPVPCPYCRQPFDDLEQFMQHLQVRHHGPNAWATVAPRAVRPNRVVDAFGALRFVPTWLVVGIVVVGLSVHESLNLWIATLLFVLVVSWAKTSRRYRHRSRLHHL
jgi:hypothetical protein